MSESDPRGKKQAETATRARSGRVAIVGRPNVGKSTLLNSLLGEPIAIISSHPQTTRDQILGVVTEDGAQFAFVDTPGVHPARNKLGAHMNQQARDAARDADAILFVTDIPRNPRKPLNPADQAILSSLPADIPVILVLNKVDLVRDKTELLPMLQAFSEAYDFKAIVPISARRTEGRANVLRAVAEFLPEQEFLFPTDSLSDKPMRFFVSEFVREQILRATRAEVPHGVAVVVERFDEAPKVPRIELAVHVDKETHKGIVIGAGGSLLKEIGTKARERVEQMMGKQVHLQIWVRVTPGWSESDAMLRDMGYGDKPDES